MWSTGKLLGIAILPDLYVSTRVKGVFSEPLAFQIQVSYLFHEN